MTWTNRALRTLSCLVPLALLLPASVAAHVSDVTPGGYYWADDREPGHSFQDPKFLAPQVLTLEGSATAPLALPFGFTYYGKRYDHAEATADGRLVLRFLGGERQRVGDDGRQRLDVIAARADIAVLDVFGGVRPDESSLIVYNESPEGFVTFRWASFEAGPATPITFEAHLRADGAIRFQYWNLNELLESSSYGLVGDIGLTDPSGGPGLRVMTAGNPARGFSLRSASALDFGREVPDLPGPNPEPKAVQCPPAYGLPNDFPTWCDRVQAGEDRIPGNADDKDVCLANVTDGTHTPCTTSQTQEFLFREDAFCQGCPYTFYVLVDCGVDMHMPTHDVEAMRVSIIDLNTGLPQLITAENECVKNRDLGIAWPYCNGCSLVGAIFPKEDPYPAIGKPANSCNTFGGPAPEQPCLAYQEVATSVGWGTPINQSNPDANGNTYIDPDEMDAPPCADCNSGTVPPCNCGTDTGANRVTEEQDIDVVLYGSPTLTGVYRLELLSGGFEWQLYTNCDGNNTPLYSIYDKCSDAIAAYNPLPELALDTDPAISFFVDDETGCPTTVRVGVTMCNEGGGPTPPALPSAPFTIRFFAGATQVGTPFNGDMADPTISCDSGTGTPLDINECRTCYFDVPVGQSDVTAELTIDRGFAVDECSETPSAVQCRLTAGTRTRRIPVCFSACVVNAIARVTGSPFCFGTPVTVDASLSTISSCAGGPEYQYEELDRVTGLWNILSAFSPSNTFVYVPSTDGAKTVRVIVRCASNTTCESTSAPVNFTVATDSDRDGVSDSCGDLCPNTPNINAVPTDCDGDGNTTDPGEAVGQQCEQDGDFIGDQCDNCPTTFNVDQENSDSDALGDECDNCRLAANPLQEDADSDSLGNICDNCVTVANNAFQDLNNDGVFDALTYGEFPQSDLDNDLLGDLCDNCPYISNPGHLAPTDCDADGNTTDPGEAIGEQCDRDGDGVGDGCDSCPSDANPRNNDPAGFDCNGNGVIQNGPGEPFGEAWLEQCDFDGDGVGDPCDNCPTIFNAIVPPATQQVDTDSDGVGNICDNCPFVSNPPNTVATDCDNDGIFGEPGEGVGEQCNVCLCLGTPVEACSGLFGDAHAVLEKNAAGNAVFITSRDDIANAVPPVPPQFTLQSQGDYTVDLFGVPVTPNFIDIFNVYRGTLASLRQLGLALDDPARYDHAPFTPVGLESCAIVPGGAITEPRSAPFTVSAKGIYDTVALADAVAYYYLIIAECAADSLEGGYGANSQGTAIPFALTPCP